MNARFLICLKKRSYFFLLVEPHRQEPVAPFKNATSREFRIPPPAGVGGFQFAGIKRDEKLNFYWIFLTANFSRISSATSDAT